MSQEHVTFFADNLRLEGILHLPHGEPPFPAIVVCHPHPLYGGDMHNNIVLAICHAMTDVSIAALRFNFRGVGRSQGDFGDGIGERKDVDAALAFLASMSEINLYSLGLAGYSFGTKVAFPVAVYNDRVQAVVLVSPFISDSDYEQQKGYVKPKLFLCGGEDYLTSLRKIQWMAEEFPETTQCKIIPGADHFWWGYEEEVAKRVSSFFATVFKTDII